MPPVSPKDCYEEEIDQTAFYQGDIIRDVPIIFLPDKISKWFILRPGANSKKHVDDVLRGDICKWFESTPAGQLKDAWQHGNSEEYVAAKASLVNVMILTQTCDLEHRSYYQIAPVYPESNQKESALPNLRENNINYAFYLPAKAPYIPENSYADLSHNCVVPKSYFPKNSVAERLAERLTNGARAALQAHMAHCFGRPFGFNERDRARVAGEYACVWCFYKSGASVKMNFQAGVNFTPCNSCGAALWIRVG
jgi:hypothetical protein